MGGANARGAGRDWIPDRTRDGLGFRAHAGRIETYGGRCRSYETAEIACLDLRRRAGCAVLDWSFLSRSPQREQQCGASRQRGGYRFIDSAKIDCGLAVRKSER